MTVQLDWPPEVVDRLTAEARQKGLALEAYLLQAVLHQPELQRMASETEVEKRRQRADAGARMLALQQRVKPDPEGWTSRDYIDNGRR